MPFKTIEADREEFRTRPEVKFLGDVKVWSHYGWEIRQRIWEEFAFTSLTPPSRVKKARGLGKTKITAIFLKEDAAKAIRKAKEWARHHPLSVHAPRVKGGAPISIGINLTFAEAVYLLELMGSDQQAVNIVKKLTRRARKSYEEYKAKGGGKFNLEAMYARLG